MISCSQTALTMAVDSRLRHPQQETPSRNLQRLRLSDITENSILDAPTFAEYGLRYAIPGATEPVRSQKPGVSMEVQPWQLQLISNPLAAES